MMSVLPSSAACLSAAMRNEAPDCETFKQFFEWWLLEQNNHLQELISASKQLEQRNSSTSSTSSLAQLQDLITRVVQHYEYYYRAKSRWVKLDVLGMLSPSWRTSLEDAFPWIGGWRPSMAFHLLYSKSGLQLEARLHELIRGLSTGDLGDLSPIQFSRVDELQRVTIREEKDLTEKLAKLQETVADSSMVELTHLATELMRQNHGGIEEDKVESALQPKEEGLVEILLKADDLRLRTLKGVIENLTPIQAIYFLIAAAELHLRLHDWGKKRGSGHPHTTS